MAKPSDKLYMYRNSNTGDFNAKNEFWGGQSTDEKGEKILEFVVSNNLTLLNHKDSPPTFKTSRAKGWIDLTMVNAAWDKNIKTWDVLKEFNNSYHRYIRTVIENVELQEMYGLTLSGEAKLIEVCKMINDWRKYRTK